MDQISSPGNSVAQHSEFGNNIVANPVRVAFYPNKTNTTPQKKLLPWPDLVKDLMTVRIRRSKDGAMHSPAVIADGKTRADENVVALSFLEADYDHLTPQQAEEVKARYIASGLEHAIYSTYQHTPEAPRFRVVIPIDAPIRVQDWPQLQPRIWEHVFGPHADPDATDPSRAYYSHSCPPGAVHFAEHHRGAVLNPYELPPATSTPIKARTSTTQGEPIREGGRNAALIRIAGANRRAGCTEEEIACVLLKVNANRCDPPLPEAEVRAIAESAARYDPVPESELVNAAIIARLDQAEAELAELKTLHAKSMAVLRNQKLRGERVTALATTFEIASAESRGETDEEGCVKVYVPALAEKVGITPRAFSTHLDHLEEWGIVKKTHRTGWHKDIDHVTGEITERPRTELWIKLEAPPVETLDRLITFEPPREDHRGGRSDRGPQCPDDPDAPIIHRYYCGKCYRLLDETVISPPSRVCRVEEDDAGGENDPPIETPEQATMQTLQGKEEEYLRMQTLHRGGLPPTDDPPAEACPRCGTWTWWRRRDGVWCCGQCPPEEVTR